MIKHAALALGLAVVIPAGASTLFPTVGENGPPQIGIGLAALVENEGYKDGGTETEPLPVFFYQGDRLRVLGPQLTYRLFGDRSNNIGLRVDYRFDGYDKDDGAIFAGMAERKSGIAVGFAGQLQAGPGNIYYSAAKSASASKGMYATIQYGIPTTIAGWTVTPRVGVEYFNARYADYYFGVHNDEARAGRPAHAPGSAFNLDAGIDVHRDLGRHHTVFGSVKYRRYDSAIKDSPLMEKSASPRLNIGYLYRF
jgi:outer membrane protein